MSETDDLARPAQGLQKSNDVTLARLGDALERKDRTTNNHSKRVTAYTIAIARAIGLSKQEISVIARGAFLHDIGKMAIPYEILCKPGKLTHEEMLVVREHSYRGYQVVAKIPFLVGTAADIVYAHHEHYDGLGYPRGLKGENIPLGARLVAIANTLDSITSDLPYRKAQSVAAAYAEIYKCAGSQFDPQIVEAFLRMPQNIWEDLRSGLASGKIG